MTTKIPVELSSTPGIVDGSNATAITIDSSENVGIGTSSPSSPNGFNKFIEIEGSSASLVLADSDATTWEIGSAGGNLKFFEGTDTFMTINTSGNVGIGTSTIDEKLHIQGSVNNDDIAIKIENNYDDNLSSSRPSAALTFTAASSNGHLRVFGAPANTAANHQIDLGSTAGSTFITFSPSNSEAMRIDSSGNVLVGKTSASITTAGAELRPNGQVFATQSGNYPLLLNRTTSDGDIIQLRKDNTTVGSIGVAANDNIYFAGESGSTKGIYINDAAVYPANTGGNVVDAAVALGQSGVRWTDLYLSGGVYVGGTGSANYLDDYEEGTWTPTFAGGTTAGTYTYGSREARYTKIGRFVQISAKMNGITDSVEGSGSLHITGLPFAVSSTTDSTSGFGAVVFEFFNVSDDTYNVACEAVEAASYVRFWESKDNAANALVSATDRVNDSADLWFSVAYETDA